MGWTRAESDDNEMTWSEEGNLVSRRITFEETAGAGVYTGTLVIPAGGVVHSILTETTAAWDAATTLMDAGYTGNLTSFSSAVDVDAAGNNAAVEGWSNGGAMLPGEGYFAAGTTLTFAVTTTGAGGTTGRMFIVVTYSVPPAASAAIKA